LIYLFYYISAVYREDVCNDVDLYFSFRSFLKSAEEPSVAACVIFMYSFLIQNVGGGGGGRRPTRRRGKKVLGVYQGS